MLRLWGPWQCQERRGAGSHGYRRYSALRVFLASGHSAPERIKHGGGEATWIMGTLAMPCTHHVHRGASSHWCRKYGAVSFFLASGTWLQRVSLSDLSLLLRASGT